MGKTLPATHQIVNGLNIKVTWGQKFVFLKVLISETVREREKRTEICDHMGDNGQDNQINI